MVILCCRCSESLITPKTPACERCLGGVHKACIEKPCRACLPERNTRYAVATTSRPVVAAETSILHVLCYSILDTETRNRDGEIPVVAYCDAEGDATRIARWLNATSGREESA